MDILNQSLEELINAGGFDCACGRHHSCGLKYLKIGPGALQYLVDALKAAGVSRVDVVGIAESHCVKDTALDAKKLGFEVTVFEDLTVPVSEELGVAARKQMAAGGITLAESR